ncbi:signal recognition particle subunit SRP54 [Candidatus Nanopelagicus limnes]|uniref:signal-recognition-particle GTPase n=1 Tax=Candidatus Nanopelagicus limnae TaxID=1884634 RepID=A0A249JY91_9ACTN|nr:signal recognition particle protein [Candidatus Nanopelagicus limnes]ASY09503.1 signal recognition particle subunit SRP54 [Candidatus Nanopelagicus limnes]
MFEALGQRFTSLFSGLRGKVSQAQLVEFSSDIKNALLDSDVALLVADKFSKQVLEEFNNQAESINKSTNPSQKIFEIVNAQLTQILGGSERRLKFAKVAPTVILLIGLQGAGKTSLAGKLANYLKLQGNTPLLVAADLQRPNAVNQLQVVGESTKTPVFAPEPGNGVGNPISVAKAGVEFAKEKLHNFVIIDTAGRTGIDQELMNQVTSIRDAVKPDEIFFVVDAMTGQDAAVTAKAFADGVGFDAVVLTKLDGDARGGAALSIVEITGKPIIFASTGEKISDFDLFYPDRMASRILGMGDVASLAEQAKRAMPEETSKKLEDKFVKGEEFTFEDFLSQLEAMKNMGSMSKLMGLLPGAAGMKKQIENFDESELVRTRAIIQSMTPMERNDPKVLNGSRRSRIALGSGRAVSEINSLVERFSQAQKMMKQMRGGNMPAGLPNIGSMPKPQQSNNIPKKKSRSGNPAKRALEEGI